MRSCDDCQNNITCAGINLHPVLLHVYNLYAGGMTDKFDILFALKEEEEKLLERFTYKDLDICWSKAALMTISDVLVREAASNGDPADIALCVMTTARDAFRRFPWKLEEIIEQAPGLYQLLIENAPESFTRALSKRQFTKICKDVAYE